MSYFSVSDHADTVEWLSLLYFLKGFVIDKARSVFRYVELPFLQMLAELPGRQDRCQASPMVWRLVDSAQE